MAERAGYVFKSGKNLGQWEDSDFPLICDPCLGPEDLLEFLKIPQSKQCGYCGRPFNVFKLRSGQRQTVNCRTCCQLRNSCQFCTLDLRTHEPVADYYGDSKRIPVSEGNRQIFVQ